ncbi:MAG: B12-binding domain-containing radical SAM protein [Deltaproteobacteria bacterium]|nr:B12-binding domain-containing radical SAM protein [Deltaproteobacteria bacterium]
MRALLVYAAFPRTYWGFQHGLPIAGKRASLPPLGLVTLAAHLPAGFELRLVDMNIEPLTDEHLRWADVLLVGGMRIQTPSMHAVLGRARARGAAGPVTVVGGPAATTSPEDFPDADVVFRGEVEGRADSLVRAIEARLAARGSERPPEILDAPGCLPEISTGPLPRFDLLDLGAYASMCLQYSRGCPFRCEFCDIIEIFGRVARVKAPEQVLAELGALHELGYRGTLFFVDDNFIGNLREVKKLLPRLRQWQEERGRPLELYTEASVNLARDPELVRAMVQSGFTSVFVGIESPSPDVLRDAGKSQNARVDLVQAVETLTRGGLEVMGGFIVGFDGDGPEIFEAQLRFLADAPIPLAMVGVLTALPGTALWRRLEREGRLRADSNGDQFGRPNYKPAMNEETLLRGYADLLSRLYSPDGYLRRCEAYLRLSPAAARTGVRPGGVAILARAIVRLGLFGSRRRHFWSLLGQAVRRSPRTISWAIGHAIQGEHLIRYTREDVLPRIQVAIEELRAGAAEPACTAG